MKEGAILTAGSTLTNEAIIFGRENGLLHKSASDQNNTPICMEINGDIAWLGAEFMVKAITVLSDVLRKSNAPDFSEALASCDESAFQHLAAPTYFRYQSGRYKHIAKISALAKQAEIFGRENELNEVSIFHMI